MTNTSGTCRKECEGGGVHNSGHGEENELDEGVEAVRRLVIIDNQESRKSKKSERHDSRERQQTRADWSLSLTLTDKSG